MFLTTLLSCQSMIQKNGPLPSVISLDGRITTPMSRRRCGHWWQSSALWVWRKRQMVRAHCFGVRLMIQFSRPCKLRRMRLDGMPTITTRMCLLGIWQTLRARPIIMAMGMLLLTKTHIQRMITHETVQGGLTRSIFDRLLLRTRNRQSMMLVGAIARDIVHILHPTLTIKGCTDVNSSSTLHTNMVILVKATVAP